MAHKPFVSYMCLPIFVILHYCIYLFFYGPLRLKVCVVQINNFVEPIDYSQPIVTTVNNTYFLSAQSEHKTYAFGTHLTGTYLDVFREQSILKRKYDITKTGKTKQ